MLSQTCEHGRAWAVLRLCMLYLPEGAQKVLDSYAWARPSKCPFSDIDDLRDWNPNCKQVREIRILRR